MIRIPFTYALHSLPPNVLIPRILSNQNAEYRPESEVDASSSLLLHPPDASEALEMQNSADASGFARFNSIELTALTYGDGLSDINRLRRIGSLQIVAYRNLIPMQVFDSVCGFSMTFIRVERSEFSSVTFSSNDDNDAQSQEHGIMCIYASFFLSAAMSAMSGPVPFRIWRALGASALIRLLNSSCMSLIQRYLSNALPHFRPHPGGHVSQARPGAGTRRRRVPKP